jgi:predicted nuclease of restriction endonuclease-like (RecB) superfamily
LDGLSSRNLWRMRLFYLAYVEILPPAVAEIGWTHNYIILEKCKDPNERLFYIYQTRNNGWTKNVLIHQIENQTYEKTLISQHNFDKTLPESLHQQAILAVKDDYAFDFLELSDQLATYSLTKTLPKELSAFSQRLRSLLIGLKR